MNQTPIATPSSVAPYVDDGFDDFRASVAATFHEATRDGSRLFHTHPARPFDVYLDAAPLGERRTRDCRACAHFLNRYAGLVVIDESGRVRSALWDPKTAPRAYRDAASALKHAAERASVSDVFLSSELALGRPVDGIRKDDPHESWTHLAVVLPPSMRFKSSIVSAEQAIAEKREERAMLHRGLNEFPADVVRKAVALLSADSLARAEKHTELAKWLLALHEKVGPNFTNHVWRAVASAPPGWCHVRSGMIGTLLEDLQSGMPFEAVKRRWDEKMHPLAYQRPQAPPRAGQIDAAERVVAKLGIERSLERRYARLADVQALWRPREVAAATTVAGVFGHLRGARASTPIETGAPPTTMTFEKFSRVVLPTAEQIELYVPSARGVFVAYVTAMHADAPPIIQWDREERRNPVSLYTYDGGSLPAVWNVAAGTYVPVTALVLKPSMWDPDRAYPNHGRGVLFALRGARDLTYVRGAGLFPEILRADLHAIRSTIEAHARTAVIGWKNEAEVCGLFLGAGASTWDYRVRVTARGVVTLYRLDRWD